MDGKNGGKIETGYTSIAMTANLKIESMLIRPTKWGIETIKQKQNEKT